ncbi:hypothetical protein PF70_01616 [Pseudomonas asplenii]|nr:hypothetical protein PF70_01616 [Pseudomonas fuscovaginae]
MNTQLARLISDYQASVRMAVQLMQRSGFELPATPIDWLAADIPEQGTLEGGVRYFKHGHGCAVLLSTGAVSFDFGAQGQIDGFNVGRLAGFAASRLPGYGFATEDALKACFKAEVEQGALVYSGDVLYYVAGAAHSYAVDLYTGSPSRLEVESASYHEFLERWEQGLFAGQRLGQAFYNHYRLHRLADQACLQGLYEADGDKARALISRVFQIR